VPFDCATQHKHSVSVCSVSHFLVVLLIAVAAILAPRNCKLEFYAIYQSVLSTVMKNCDPLVFGPELAMLSVPGPVCFSTKFSSSNFRP